MRMYFNKPQDTGIYFAVWLADEHLYPERLWERLDPDLLYAKDRNDPKAFGVRPRQGREREAFTMLLTEAEAVH